MALSLHVRSLAHAYATHPVVRDLNFELAAGRIGCLLGPSGCGKTTVLRCIAGFERAQQGEIRIGDQVVSGPGVALPPERRSVGMVFQDYALFPHLTAAGNIAFGLPRRAGQATRERVRAMLELVGLADAAEAFPHMLSGGQQQRVAIARALAPAPGVLLLDEPFSNLDGDLRERLSLEVRAILKAAGTTAILVTHDQHEAFAMADDIGVMRDGALEQWDSAYALYHQPRTRFVADFVGQGVFLRGLATPGGGIRTELGELPPCGGPGRPSGQQYDVLVRPDDIVHDDASPMRAEVLGKTFRGAEFLYTLRLGSGAQVLAVVPSHHDHALGEAIGIRLAIDHVVAFPASAAGDPP